MRKTERFGLVLTPPEKQVLARIAAREMIPASAVVRRLVWREGQRQGLIPIGGIHPEGKAQTS